jgi:rhodanese-related sulfurtransferase
MGFFSKLFGLGGASSADIAEAVKKGALLIDVRSPAEFKSGSVKGALNIPVDNLTAKFNQVKGKDTVVVFCRSGNRSRMAKGILHNWVLKPSSMVVPGNR